MVKLGEIILIFVIGQIGLVLIEDFLYIYIFFFDIFSIIFILMK